MDNPAYFTFEEGEKIEPYSITMWDETHVQCAAGTDNGKGIALRPNRSTRCLFKRGTNGQLDLANGTYSEEIVSPVKVKYPKEVRLGLGCAVDVEYDSSDPNKIIKKTGIRLKPFVYTSRLLVGIKRFEEAIANENRRVQNLPANFGLWIEMCSNLLISTLMTH